MCVYTGCDRVLCHVFVFWGGKCVYILTCLLTKTWIKNTNIYKTHEDISKTPIHEIMDQKLERDCI